VTAKQLIKSLKKYHPDIEIIQGGVRIKAVRIWEIPDPAHLPGTGRTKHVVRLIREDEKRA
jgi:hypothetical protein